MGSCQFIESYNKWPGPPSPPTVVPERCAVIGLVGALRRKSGDIEIPAGPPALRCKLDKAALKGDQGVSGPLKCLVTGCAGFIGSHTAEKLLEEGCRVVGVDDFDPYYPRRVKLANLSDLLNSPGFKFVE